jgi:hypothetical protein
MNHISITNDTELHHRIMKLNYLKEEQELAIKRNVRELAYSVHPSMIVKNIMNKLSDDKETSHDLKSAGLNIGKDFLINRFFGRSGAIKGYITSLLVKKATDYVINNHPNLLASGINKLNKLFEPKQV